jgi:hypothetical protein
MSQSIAERVKWILTGFLCVLFCTAFALLGLAQIIPPIYGSRIYDQIFFWSLLVVADPILVVCTISIVLEGRRARKR